MKDLYKKEARQEIKKTKNAPVESKVKKEAKRSLTKTNAYRILIKPLVTEKASIMGAQNKYLFAVDRKANKIEIAKAIEDIYGIKPAGINVIKMRGKFVTRGRSTGKRKDWKKAIVTLPEGQTIQVYEGI